MMSEKAPISITIDPELEGVLRLGGLLQTGVTVTESRGDDLARTLSDTETEIRQLYEGRTPGEIPGTKPARRLYRSIGEDPTRMRPASEALLRRLLKGNALPEINNVVDTANLISLRHLIPVGLYDADCIEGDVLIRLGRDDEKFQRIGAGTLNLHSRLGLFDEQGGFGNPTGDSRRTCVTPETKNILLTAFFPAEQVVEDIVQMIDDAEAAFSRFTGGTSIRLGENGWVKG